LELIEGRREKTAKPLVFAALRAALRGCSLRSARAANAARILRNRTMIDEEQQSAALTNLERLKAHLATDSLGERFVLAATAAGDAPLLPALRKVVADRLEEIKHKHEPVPDQQA
jgi:hypothetical protein